MATNKTDVLIIGGGPAGTTFGSLIKRKGWDVTLLEKATHPRFHIGESLLPMNLPILERLGVLEEVRQIGVPKLGADFSLGDCAESHKTFYFRDALGTSPPQAFEVLRSEFDNILFGHCKSNGVNTLEGITVQDVRALAGSEHEVEALDSNGKIQTWQTRFLVDASGRDAFMSTVNGWRKRNPTHASAAVFGHFTGVERRPAEDAGNISLYWFKHGWIWMIPLQNDLMSVGAVCRPDYLKTRQGSLDQFLVQTLNGLPEVRARMADATAAIPANATGNYSYSSERMCGPGYLILGDAYAFIDPVFSSGVYLAMSGAERAIPVAQASLEGRRREQRKAGRRFQRETNRGLRVFSWFIYRFTSPVMSDLMSNPRNVLRVVQAVVSMLAGDVFSNKRVRRRLLVFKTIYSVSWLLNWRKALPARKLRLAATRAEAQQATKP